MTPTTRIPYHIAEATRLTREGRLADAVALLRTGGSAEGTSGPGPASSTPARGGGPAAAAPAADVLEMRPPAAHGGAWTVDTASTAGAAFAALQRKLGKSVRPPRGVRAGSAAPELADGARFDRHVFSGADGQRDYWLYVPAAADPAAPRPLLVMLHGCTQSAGDFARGTRMNALAEARGFLVAWPEQPASANPSRCWNWFNAADQSRDSGEPALLSGIARAVMADHAIDARRVFVAGLSAGGAAAATLGQLYPDLFAAVGVHSGLAHGAARDMTAAFGAMRSGGTATAGRAPVRTIVVHGDADGTVHPSNAEQVLSQAAAGAALATRVDGGHAPGGLAYTRTRHIGADGAALLESWDVQGLGHAWSGGSSDGSYTAPDGPDASAAMVAFFLDGG